MSYDNFLKLPRNIAFTLQEQYDDYQKNMKSQIESEGSNLKANSTSNRSKR